MKVPATTPQWSRRQTRSHPHPRMQPPIQQHRMTPTSLTTQAQTQHQNKAQANLPKMAETQPSPRLLGRKKATQRLNPIQTIHRQTLLMNFLNRMKVETSSSHQKSQTFAWTSALPPAQKHAKTTLCLNVPCRAVVFARSWYSVAEPTNPAS